MNACEIAVAYEGRPCVLELREEDRSFRLRDQEGQHVMTGVIEQFRVSSTGYAVLSTSHRRGVTITLHGVDEESQASLRTAWNRWYGSLVDDAVRRRREVVES